MKFVFFVFMAVLFWAWVYLYRSFWESSDGVRVKSLLFLFIISVFWVSNFFYFSGRFGWITFDHVVVVVLLYVLSVRIFFRCKCWSCMHEGVCALDRTCRKCGSSNVSHRD